MGENNTRNIDSCIFSIHSKQTKKHFQSPKFVTLALTMLQSNGDDLNVVNDDQIIHVRSKIHLEDNLKEPKKDNIIRQNQRETKS